MKMKVKNERRDHDVTSSQRSNRMRIKNTTFNLTNQRLLITRERERKMSVE